MILAQQYQEGLITLPIYDATSLVKGQGLKWGVDGSAVGVTALIDVAATGVDIFAVLAETPATTTTNIQTPVIYQAQVQMVNNVPVWKIYWDLALANDIDVTSSTSTVVTHAAGDDDLDGGWIYINSGTGAGQLRYVKAATTTTKTVNTAFTTTPDSTSDFILIRPVGKSTGGVDMDTTFKLLKSAVSATGKILILKSFIEGPVTGELDITKNSQFEINGANTRGVRFYSHVIFHDTALAPTGI